MRIQEAEAMSGAGADKLRAKILIKLYCSLALGGGRGYFRGTN